MIKNVKESSDSLNGLTFYEAAEGPTSAVVLVLAGPLTLAEPSRSTPLTQADWLLVRVVVLVHSSRDTRVDEQLAC